MQQKLFHATDVELAAIRAFKSITTESFDVSPAARYIAFSKLNPK